MPAQGAQRVQRGGDCAQRYQLSQQNSEGNIAGFVYALGTDTISWYLLFDLSCGNHHPATLGRELATSTRLNYGGVDADAERKVNTDTCKAGIAAQHTHARTAVFTVRRTGLPLSTAPR